MSDLDITVEYAVSVIVPVYNAESYIEATLESILVQEFRDFEVLLVDDCSTDESAKRIEPFLSERVRYLRESVNSGGPATPRNTGIRNARGKYIAIFDSDDIMFPHKLGDAVRYLEQHPEVGMLFTNFQAIDERGEIVRADFLSNYQRFRQRLSWRNDTVGLIGGSDAYKELLRANYIGTSGVVIPRAVFAAVGGFDEKLSNGDDYDMWLRIARSYDVLFVNRLSHQYRLRSGSISFRGSRNAVNRIQVLERQLLHDLDGESRRLVRGWIAENYCLIGSAEKTAGNGKAARTSFRKALQHRISMAALKGCVGSMLGR